jgi:hypothetical protein
MRPCRLGVSTVPGQIAFTRTPWATVSAAAAFVSPMSAALVDGMAAIKLFAADGRVLATVPASATAPAKGGRITMAPAGGSVLTAGVVHQCRLVLPGVGDFGVLEDFNGKALTAGDTVFVHASFGLNS